MNCAKQPTLGDIIAKLRRTGAIFEMTTFGEAAVDLLHYIAKHRPDFTELPGLIAKCAPLLMNTACAFDLSSFVQRYASILQRIARGRGTKEAHDKTALDAELAAIFASKYEFTLLASALQQMTLRCLSLPVR